MKKPSGIMLQTFTAFVLAVAAACTPTAANKNQTNGNANPQTSANANAPQPVSPTEKYEQAGTGSIEVISRPPGAKVILISLDEEGAEPQQKGSTPTTLTNIPAGKYTVDIEMNGYKFFQKNIKVLENKTVQVSATLRKD
jgi:PEGA domain